MHGRRPSALPHSPCDSAVIVRGKTTGIMHTQSSVYLIGLGCDEDTSASMLVAKFVVQLVLDFDKVGIGLAGYRNCLGLVLSCVCFDKVLERVVVDII